MKFSRIILPFVAFAFAAGVAACSDSVSKKSGTLTDESGITSLGYSFDMKNAKKYFRITNPDGEPDFTLTLETTVQWPVEIGDYNIKPLQDTIINLVAGKSLPTISDAMLAFVSNAAEYPIGDNITEVDSVPSESEFNTSFYAQTNISVSEITDELITFNCVSDQYMGGAHNMTTESPFTYDFKSGNFISLKWLFTDPNSPSLLDAVMTAIAEEENMTADELRQSLLVTEIGIPKDVYIQNGMIVFHYNPYEILPYSFGSVDAIVSPYMIQDLLTSAAKTLLVSE